MSRPAAEVCEHCGVIGPPAEVKLEEARTKYEPELLNAWTRLLEDEPWAPRSMWERYREKNAPVMLCRPCAEEHHAYWDDMWSNVEGYVG